MRIGILTFQATNNYGGVLQSYALQKILKDLGHAPEILDYECRFIEQPYRWENLKKKGLAGYLFSLMGFLCYLPRGKGNKRFKKHMKYSERCSAESMKSMGDKYDMYIVGSDQVWNYRLTGGDMHYLLDFVKESSKKYSYAASFGVGEIKSPYCELYTKLLNEFEMIAVRESQGSEIIYDMIGKRVPVVLDPTLLLTREEWMSAAKLPVMKEKYILVYQLGISKNLVNKVKHLAKKTGCKVRYIPFPLGGFIEAKKQWRIGADEWIGLFANASYIVTDSFHGTAFSILFNKPFWTEASGQHKNVGSRIYNLLDVFGLTDRLFDSESKCSPDDAIEYESVNRILNQERTKSIDYLKTIIAYRMSN